MLKNPVEERSFSRPMSQIGECDAPYTKYQNPVSIQFGSDVRRNLRVDIQEKKLPLIVCSERGRNQIDADLYLSFLGDLPCVWACCVTENPDIESLEQTIRRLPLDQIDAIVAIGGGSAIDTAKAILAVCCCSHMSLHEIVQMPSVLANTITTELYAVPTTAGTGSEVTPYATLWDGKTGKKLSLSSERLFPTKAYVDPQLTLTCPVLVTASTGLDAINQAFESIWNKHRSPMTEAFAMRALQAGLDALPKLLVDPFDTQSREKMMECSLLAGLAISNTRTSICHSISYPLTAKFNLPHGLACAFSMSSVLKMVGKQDPALLQCLLPALGCMSMQDLQGMVDHVLHIANVREFCLTHLPPLPSLEALTSDMISPRSSNFPIPVTESLILELLQDSWTILSSV